MGSDNPVRILGRVGAFVTITAIAACTALPGATVGSPSPAPASGRTSTPRGVDYAQIEREVVQELNAARTNPAAYASNISALLPYYNGKLLTRPGYPATIQTVEGASAA